MSNADQIVVVLVDFRTEHSKKLSGLFSRKIQFTSSPSPLTIPSLIDSDETPFLSLLRFVKQTGEGERKGDRIDKHLLNKFGVINIHNNRTQYLYKRNFLN